MLLMPKRNFCSDVNKTKCVALQMNFESGIISTMVK